MADVAVERAQSERHGSSRVVRGGPFRFGGLVRFVFIAAYTGFLLLPLYWMAVTSIKRQEDQLADPPVWFPADPTSLNYSDALNNFNGWKGLENSIFVAVVTTVLAVALGTAAAYSMARFRTGGKHLAFWFLSQRMMPPIAIVIPVFLLYSRYSEEWFGFTLIDTRAGLILLYTVFALPFTVWMMYAYFRQMPPELEEAALVDGCSRWGAFWRVALPVVAPGLAVTTLFCFIFSWNEFVFALILTRRAATTLPVLISGLHSSHGVLWNELSALAAVGLIPVIILALFAQKHLVRGMTMGAVK
jgi:multiple sugar transport system permease protein